MNPQQNQDWERKLQEIEAEINQAPPKPPVQTQPGQPLTSQGNDSPSISSLLKQVTNWFNSLSRNARVIVVSAAAIVGFLVLKTVFQLVASVISLAILGAILYLVYKFFVASKAPK